jgi:hypothetical protein
MGRKIMTAKEALAEVGKVNERLQELDEKLRCAMSDPGSEAVLQLHQEITEAMSRKEWLFSQIQRMEKAGSAAASGSDYGNVPPMERRG